MSGIDSVAAKGSAAEVSKGSADSPAEGPGIAGSIWVSANASVSFSRCFT